ncbi:VOC family protein [Xanthobacter sp. VTT E-85241]|uniref:VOC family protein n=1 Tax=Roseixanthobacter finlandensis TaxID=3119922 RepID=UPI0037279CCE
MSNDSLWRNRPDVGIAQFLVGSSNRRIVSQYFSRHVSSLKAHSMFSYMMIGTNDLSRAIPFYEAVMAVLGHSRLDDYSDDHGGRWASWGAPDPGPHITVGPPFDGLAAKVGNGMMISFLANDRQAVDRFHAAALAHGGSDEGEPGLRPHYGPTFYAAYVRDPDGNKLNAVCYI